MNPRSEWIIVENAHPPIVNKETWIMANGSEERIKIQRNHHALTSNYPLTGLIRCSVCGFPFQGHTQKVKGYIYSTYIDGGWQAKRVCSYAAIPKAQIEAFAFAIVRDTLTNPKMIRRAETLLFKISEQGKACGETSMSSFSKELRTIENKKENILETLSLSDNERLRKTLLEKLSAIDSDREKVKLKMSAIKT
jgi:hypothetical protein